MWVVNLSSQIQKIVLVKLMKNQTIYTIAIAPETGHCTDSRKDVEQGGVLRLTLCQEILPGFIPSLFRVFAKPSSEVAWDGPQMK